MHVVLMTTVDGREVHRVGHYARRFSEGGEPRFTPVETFSRAGTAYAFAAFLNGGGTAHTLSETAALVTTFLREHATRP